MKKTIIVLAFISFSAVGFSQTAVANDNTSTTTVTTNTVGLVGQKAVKLGEKIQITEKGVVKYEKDYTPEYPQPLIWPEKQPVKNNNQPQNN